MKYIRTKDGHILEVGKTTDYGFVVMPECNKAVHFVDSGNEFVDVVKQANTIEELSDEFVVWYEDYETPITIPLTEKAKFEKMKEVILAGMKANINCWLKLAIWTDKGLIYVAKLNDKGEWELL